MYNNNSQGKVWRQSTDPAAGASENDLWIVTDGGGNPISAVYRFEGAWVSGPTTSLPVGSVSAYAGSSAPAGYLLCQGQAVSRTTYAALYAVISVLYGSGDGSTTFNLPDLRGEFIRGLDAGRGVDSGRVLGSAQDDMLEAHTHTINTSANGPGGGGTGPYVEGGTPVSTSSTGGTETRPRNIAMNYIIKT